MAQNIDALLEQMQLIRGRVESIEPPVSVQIATELRSQYEEELTAFARDRVEFTAALRSVEAGLLAKRNAPFTVVALDPAVATTLSLNMGRLNGILGKHNDEQGDLASRAAQARQVLADDLILQQWTRISHLQAQIHGVGEDLAEATQARDELRAEESVLQEEVVEHVSPAMELTAELAAFLGRDDITFLPSGTGYTITRSGVPAKGLSEGEKSAIALLYFLKTLKDRSFDRSGGVVVIDDPISSLDSNALFCALGYIQSEAEGIGQLIFLTHNFGFFREVRKWLIPVVGKPALPYAAYFMRCAGPCAARHVVLESLDDLLLNYDSEYQYLFKLVFAASNTTDRANIEQLFHYPNVARRLLEAFLAFRMPDISRGGLKGRLKQTNLDAAARERMLRFLDFQSHHDGIDVPEEDLSSLAEAPAVLQEVLNLMKDLDRPHFDRMCRVVAPHQIDQ
jgi:wobble nucleotide-excising tRNase